MSNCWKGRVLAAAIAVGLFLIEHAATIAHCYNQGHGAGGTTWC